MAKPTCSIHGTTLVCHACQRSVSTPAIRKASRANGKLGGRPKGSKNKSSV